MRVERGIEVRRLFICSVRKRNSVPSSNIRKARIRLKIKIEIKLKFDQSEQSLLNSKSISFIILIGQISIQSQS